MEGERGGTDVVRESTAPGGSPWEGMEGQMGLGDGRGGSHPAGTRQK